MNFDDEIEDESIVQLDDITEMQSIGDAAYMTAKSKADAQVRLKQELKEAQARSHAMSAAFNNDNMSPKKMQRQAVRDLKDS